MEIRSDCPTNCEYICGDKCKSAILKLRKMLEEEK